MENMEIERKFTLKSVPDLSRYEVKRIEQAYLCTDPVVRVRRSNDNYYMTYKSKGVLSHEEYNLPLTKEAYEHLAAKADGNVIRKNRYLIPYGDYTIELDVFDEPFAPLTFAEVEFPSVEEANSFVPPDWFDCDVTADERYSNSYLSRIEIK